MENQHTLREYTLAKQEVTKLVLEANQILEQQNNGQWVDAAHALVEKLAEDRFNLAVVGQFKRGKSSLINAVIGRDLLPTGALPLTSAITALCYGPEDRALLKFKGWILEKEIKLAELSDYITERGNPGNEKGLLEAQVEIKVPFLRRGLYFVDTPGIGSMRQENTMTTYQFLPDADAIIFVTSAESPLTEVEAQFLADIQQYTRKLFVVVNKTDLLGADDREDVLNYIQTGIEHVLGTPDFHLYPLSAKHGLEAKTQGRQDWLVASGLASFEADMTSFLAEEKGKVFLVSILDRMLNLLNGKGYTRAGRGPDQIDSSTEEERALLVAAAQMQSLRDELLAGLKLPETPPLSLKAEPGRKMLMEDAAKSLSKPVFGYQGMLRTRQCPICVAQSRAVFDFFSKWQYELTMQEEARAAFASLGGFCHTHTWQFQQIANAQGISSGYILLIGVLAEKLQHVFDHVASLSELAAQELLPTVGSCPVCQLLRSVEEHQVQIFAEQIQKPKALEVYSSSEGLCLPHLTTVIGQVEQLKIRQALVSQQIERLEELSDDLHSYLLKRSAVRRELINEEEASAWKRTLLHLAGDPTVFYGQDC